MIRPIVCQAKHKKPSPAPSPYTHSTRPGIHRRDESEVGGEGGVPWARGTLHAILGSAKADAAVRVVQRTLAGPPIEFKIVPEDLGQQRAVWDPPPDGYLLKISALHESVGRYLGPRRDEYPGQNEPHFRVLLAEIAAASVCRRLLTEKSKKRKQNQ